MKKLLGIILILIVIGVVFLFTQVLQVDIPGKFIIIKPQDAIIYFLDTGKVLCYPHSEGVQLRSKKDNYQKRIELREKYIKDNPGRELAMEQDMLQVMEEYPMLEEKLDSYILNNCKEI